MENTDAGIKSGLIPTEGLQDWLIEEMQEALKAALESQEINLSYFTRIDDEEKKALMKVIIAETKQDGLVTKDNISRMESIFAVFHYVPAGLEDFVDLYMNQENQENKSSNPNRSLISNRFTKSIVADDEIDSQEAQLIRDIVTYLEISIEALPTIKHKATAIKTKTMYLAYINAIKSFLIQYQQNAKNIFDDFANLAERLDALQSSLLSS